MSGITIRQFSSVQIQLLVLQEVRSTTELNRSAHSEPDRRIGSLVGYFLHKPPHLRNGGGASASAHINSHEDGWFWRDIRNGILM
ncbi:hypothetical protein NPIL_68291 [Nephila pilipes]|uniref:Uncharacterized protein n=1 Tax=Nephila pilipes TaxID=299642 RepID=A0A8X6UK54_NEPPI|nr:hypothetical protein NPIL_68291 [Nephila pilipes]